MTSETGRSEPPISVNAPEGVTLTLEKVKSLKPYCLKSLIKEIALSRHMPRINAFFAERGFRRLAATTRAPQAGTRTSFRRPSGNAKAVQTRNIRKPALRNLVEGVAARKVIPRPIP